MNNLQIHPELRAGAKPNGEPRCDVVRDTGFATEKFGYAPHRHAELMCRFGCGNSEFTELFRQVFTGMNGSTRHDRPSSHYHEVLGIFACTRASNRATLTTTRSCRPSPISSFSSRVDAEIEGTAVHLDEFGGRAHAHADRRRRVVAHVEVDADRKSTRLNSSHLVISYAVFCLKKKKKKKKQLTQKQKKNTHQIQ